MTLVIKPRINHFNPELITGFPKIKVYMETENMETFTLPECKDKDKESSCWYNCDVRSVKNFISYNNKSHILSIMAKNATKEDIYVIMCKLYDTGTPVRTVTKALIVEVQEESPETKRNTLNLAPFVESFSEYGEIWVQMGYPFS